MPLSDPRFLQLNAWVNQYFSTNVSPELISGDASFRRYFRVIVGSVSYIVVDSPPKLVPITPFIQIAETYSRSGIPVPKVIASDAEQGFMLLSDLGDVQLLSVLNPSNLRQYYQQALLLLNDIAKVIATDQAALPIYDDEFVLRELNIFTEWLAEHHLGLSSDDVRAQTDIAFQVLTENVRQQPQVGMHRDYHSRNIMLQDDELKVIDFQDAVIGPVTYDAVSLLRDCYIRWPEDNVNELMLIHYKQVIEAQLLPVEVSFSQYQRWFDLMGLQRHIKAAGIFARLNYRDGKPAYMADIPLTLEYIRDIASRYPELSKFSQWIGSVIIPAVKAKK
ncbi:aminoglycoside phosphotransferase [Shewanella sp. Choline-02u-19]|uniref:aminoglycoside phosphotransferase family protein n=1 Tax=unclassified Shewanella TaxID=196818 RepID=UPI000C32A5CB|nr:MULTISPECIES: phosphotransferase [unclassified Shewanella]PKG57856.1 aminoglycoside phosphotransferase [Shewanella sp. GutDb-MelDb]PKG76055.1 aminoglycoside phosphotransferase [Shewanella sp. GutCb]PKH56664.1 aminoglycoside phosphotransferase [Shewanella sp. Bg11-22]PKI30215.1 aminoglycoside phosphotransferase [Shewanella sp. Choline-02u-19]